MKWLLMEISGNILMIFIDKTQNSCQMQYSKSISDAF